LLSKGLFESEIGTLKAAHSHANLEGFMCRSTISVDYGGNLHNCDFNPKLKIQLAGRATHPTHLRDLRDSALPRRIGVAPHC
jgi:hypothetical protein